MLKDIMIFENYQNGVLKLDTIICVTIFYTSDAEKQLKFLQHV
ncbi:MAG TPA: hypothetical protein PLH70_08215 [Bacteroidales bacterium]|nr:hypothetical protein [Bacteroidales bacterium]HPZ04110.1 hypothetical protein [Bacteroidales bacterium]HQB75768.1 hypothetical protein [Bacteroidales bacterium]